MALPRAVVDTNVLIAAAISPRGVCGRLITTAADGQWQIVAPPLLLQELAAVLPRPKFRRWLTDDEARQFVADITALADVMDDPEALPEPQSRDPKDEFLIALARSARVPALISGDDHLTSLEDPRRPVITPAAYLRRLA